MEVYEQLEKEWAEFNGVDPAGMVACSSGTAALHLGLEALGLSFGSRIAIPDFTMIACARAAALASLTPLFIRCRSDLLLDPTDPQLSEVSAIMAVHVYGRRCDMDSLAAIRDKTNCFLIEDTAEAQGTGIHPKTDVACTSFYKNKIVGGQEGGAVWFRNPTYADVARELRSLGFSKKHDFIHRPRGHNYRLANCLASLILQSLHRCKLNLGYRRWSEAEYDRHCPEEWRMPPRQAPWVYDLRIPGLTREKQEGLVAALNREGIAARLPFRPMSWQPEFKSLWRSVSKYTEASKAAVEVIYLPLLTEEPQPKHLAQIEATLNLIAELLPEHA